MQSIFRIDGPGAGVVQSAWKETNGGPPMPDEKPKRKNYTTNEVYDRYHKKTYRRYNLMLRYDTDSDLIDLIDKYMVNGYDSPTKAIKAIMRGE
jgi:hypothetical protein